jgi:predicted nucleotidyltransferase component of viral defense system
MSLADEGRAESIRQRLRNEVRRRGEDVQFALERYAMERLLFRVGESAHRERFVLKGAMLFALWGGSLYRATRDLDFTGYGSSDADSVLDAFREICELAKSDDGLDFDAASLHSEPIRDQSEYVGLRIRLRAMLGRSRIPLQIDIGFGNAIEPPPEDVEFPTLLDDPSPRIRAYSQEAVVAEKMHAMVILGERNSRFKDFYDVFVLASRFSFGASRLLSAIAATFDRRSTPIVSALPLALTSGFFEERGRSDQWRAYLSRNALPGAPADFTAVGELILRFLGPPWSALAADHAHAETWPAGGPWR